MYRLHKKVNNKCFKSNPLFLCFDSSCGHCRSFCLKSTEDHEVLIVPSPFPCLHHRKDVANCRLHVIIDRISIRFAMFSPTTPVITPTSAVRLTRRPPFELTLGRVNSTTVRANPVGSCVCWIVLLVAFKPVHLGESRSCARSLGSESNHMQPLCVVSVVNGLPSVDRRGHTRYAT